MPPSKGKKPSKTSRTPPSRSPSTPAARTGEEEELRLRSLLSAAASKYPAFVSNSALIGNVSDVDSSSPLRGGEARVWVSEAAMVSSSLRPGALVSVSIAASDDSDVENSPLRSFSDGRLGHFQTNHGTNMSSGMGSYFAFATVFPAQKVMKNSVRLSSCLSCTMGFPSAGTDIFLCPVLPTNSSEIEKLKNRVSTNNRKVFLQKCKELSLKLVALIGSLEDCHEKPYHRSSVESSTSSSLNGDISSPKTPLNRQSRFSSSTPSPLLPSRCNESLAGFDAVEDISSVKLALEDDKTSEMLKIFAARWLFGRYILDGSFVALPICGKVCIFLVEVASELPLCSSNKILTPEGDPLLLNQKVHLSDSLGNDNVVFEIQNKTKVSLVDSAPSTSRKSEEQNLFLDKSTIIDFKQNKSNSSRKLGGLSKEIATLKEIISFSLKPMDSLPRYKGVLLHGPPGTGKTSLACHCAHEVGANFFSVNGPEIVSQYYGESEKALCEVFESAQQAAPAVVFIDELDAIAPARKDGGEFLSLRMVATLLNLMDGITESAGVLLIAATNRPDSIDPALRRPGRLQREIEIGVPSPGQRLEIFNTILDQMCHSLENNEVQALASSTHGFVGADLAALCNEAAMVALRRHINSKRNVDMRSLEEINSVSHAFSEISVSQKSWSTDPVEHDSDSTSTCMHYPSKHNILEDMLKVTYGDFEKAKLKVRPSAMREVMLELPTVNWEDVGGQAEIKNQLFEAVQLPHICPDAFERIGIRPPRGLLMFGPPGCSKTLMARAVASEAKLNFLAVKGPELFSKWVGESEKAVKSLFTKARANSPSIIFFDEIDGLAITRGQDDDGTSVADRVLSQLLVELDGLDQRSGVTVIAATNRPDKIDPALLRTGRFDRHLDVKPPNASDREAIFSIYMRGIPYGCDVNLKHLTHLTEGYTGADIKLVCREAAIAALEESFETSEISMNFFEEGIRRVQPTETEFYQKLSDKFKRYVNSAEPNQ